MKLHLCFDVLTGRFQHFQLTDGMTADSTAADPLPQGSLRLGLIFRSMKNSLILKANSYLADETGERFRKDAQGEDKNTFIRKIRIGKTATSGLSRAERLSQAETNKRRRSRHRAKRKAKTPSKALLRRRMEPLYHQYRRSAHA